MNVLVCIYYLVIVQVTLVASTASYAIDNRDGMGRRFDGIGGLSGGGATSKLLVNYPEPQRSEILDYLFKPNFGASLPILKVEIGGDSQSTDGVESSHMHEEDDENYERGYEWWLMVEAKKRNPDIKLYGLPWAFPGWVGEYTQSPYVNPSKTAGYIIKWLQGAQKYYNLTIDYIGSWNERQFNMTYIEVLRGALDASGFTHIKIVCADGGWGVANSVINDTTFAKAVDIIGTHYPRTFSTPAAMKTGKTLWASEDYTTANNNTGAACWGRILNQNYVNGHLTATIAWNLIAAYYENLPFDRHGLMTAVEPWSGHYVVESPIWITAHTTQFTQPGWTYFAHGSGVGNLTLGGTYVSFLSPDGKDFTMVIETMSFAHSKCYARPLANYTVEPQDATFVFKGDLSSITSLHMWQSQLGFDGEQTTLMEKQDAVQVVDGSFTIHVGVDAVYTLTTLGVGSKGQHPTPPPAKPFPLPYQDDFEDYPLNTEAYNFVPQMGVWEIRDSGDPDHKQVNAQVILHHPVDWCYYNHVIVDNNVTLNVGGDFAWTDVSLQADIFLPGGPQSASGVHLGLHIFMKSGSCKMVDTQGVFAVINPGSGILAIYHDMDLTKMVTQTTHSVPYGVWFTMSMEMRGTTVTVYVNGEQRIKYALSSPAPNGFTGYGTTNFGSAYFDNVKITA